MASYELSGSVTDKEKSFIETWENVGRGSNYIIRENRRGDEVYEEVAGKRTFKLSTYDRMLTEDKIADERYDPFKNGAFRPIIVPEGINIESNPNALSDEDISRLFAASDDAWEAYMDVIDSPATLQRMIDLADNGTDLSHSRYRQLESMYGRHSKVGKRLLTATDPEIQERIDKLGGSENEPSRKPGRPRKTPAQALN